MKKFLAPMGVFLFGQAIVLLLTLFMGAIGNSAEQLASDTASMASTFWGWTWVVAGTKLWVYIFVELIVLFFTALTWLKQKD